MELLTARQLAEWEEYNKIDPIGEERSDIRFAYLAMTITNAFISAYGKKGSQLTKLTDHLIDWDVTKEKEIKTQSVEEMKEVLKSIASRFNKRTRKKEVKR